MEFQILELHQSLLIQNFILINLTFINENQTYLILIINGIHDDYEQNIPNIKY